MKKSNVNKIVCSIILDNNPLSIASYAEEYPDNWKKMSDKEFVREMNDATKGIKRKVMCGSCMQDVELKENSKWDEMKNKFKDDYGLSVGDVEMFEQCRAFRDAEMKEIQEQIGILCSQSGISIPSDVQAIPEVMAWIINWNENKHTKQLMEILDWIENIKIKKTECMHTQLIDLKQKIKGMI